jgi:hypothetical protein
MDTKDLIVADVRKRLGRLFLAQLDDDTLFEVYQLMQADTSFSEMARWMRARRLAQDISELSLPKLLASAKKRLAPILLEQEAKKRYVSIPDLTSLDPVSRLQTIIEIYSRLVHSELQASVNGQPLNPTLSKHILTLSNAERKLIEIKATQSERWNLADMPADVRERLLGELFASMSTIAKNLKTFKSEIDACEGVELLVDGCGNPIQ